MKIFSKKYRDQVHMDEITLREVYFLDHYNSKYFKKYGSINLFSLIFNQLQHYVTSSIINEKSEPYSKDNYFPCVNSNYLKKQVKFKKIKKNKLETKKLEIKNKILSLIPYAKISAYNVNSDIYGELKNYLNKNFIFTKKALFQPIYLKFLNEQTILLDKYLNKISKKYNFKNKNYSSNFINYIKHYFSNSNDYEIDNSDFLFVGSNAILENRITSARYLQKKRKVISFNHANYNTSIIDEPNQEFAEHVFCNYYIDYGSIKLEKKQLKSNFFRPKIIRFNNSKIFKKVQSINNDEKKTLYIPDSFNGDHRAGPYREMDDRDYYKFQSQLVNLGKDIYLKKHPKEIKFHPQGSYAYKYFKFDKKKIIKKNLSQVISKFNLFIVDRISQAFFEILKTNAKILYLNIGRRKIKKKIINEIKKRAVVADIDPYKISNEKLEILIKKALKFERKKSKILNLACLTSNDGKKDILNLF